MRSKYPDFLYLFSLSNKRTYTHSNFICPFNKPAFFVYRFEPCHVSLEVPFIYLENFTVKIIFFFLFFGHLAFYYLFYL